MYFLFAGYHYYPLGGERDCKYFSSSIDDVYLYLKENSYYDWWEILTFDETGCHNVAENSDAR